MIASLVTTFNRPAALMRSLPQIAALGAPVLVVDDGSEARWTRELEREAIAEYIYLPRNRGLAAAMNVGLSYWLADKSVDWISVFQDDVDVRPDLFRSLEAVAKNYVAALYTGHDSGDHATVDQVADFKIKKTCAGVHLHGRREFWASIMPIPTLALGAPKRIAGQIRGLGSNVDWWIVRDSPHSVQKQNGRVICLPGLVRTFLYKAADSSWGNAPKCGEDPPLKSA